MSGCVAVIPARGGSRRIARKNIRPFLGRPVLHYPIATARASGLFDDILVSTDDAEIAAVAVDAGASVPFLRPAALADDHTGTAAVLAHAVAWLTAAGREPRTVCCLYPTAVFTRADDLRAARERLDTGNADCVFGACAFAHPIQRALVDRGDGRLRPVDADGFGRRTQDLAPAYHDAGQFYWYRTAAGDAANPPSLDGSLAYVFARHHIVDLDEPQDWEYAEALYRLRFGTGE